MIIDKRQLILDLYDSVFCEYGSEEQIKAYNNICDAAEKLGFDDDESLLKMTNDEAAYTLFTFVYQNLNKKVEKTNA